MGIFKKAKTTWKKVKYYVGATVCAGAFFGGLTMVGKNLIADSDNIHVRCFVGDVGTGEKGEELVAERMKKEGCQEIAMLGDTIYEVGLQDPDDPKFDKHFWDFYQVFPRIVMTQGNHDSYSSQQGLESWIILSARHPSIIYPAHFFTYQSGDWCYFSWFSEAVERDDDNKFSRAQDDFAKNIRFPDSCKIKVSISHHPMKSSGEHGDCKKNVCEFYKRNIIGKYDIAFAGHEHDLEDVGEIGGTYFYISGGGSKTRPCMKNDGKTCWGKLGFMKFIGNSKTPEIILVE